MWGTSRRVAGATMPSFTTQARNIGQGGPTGSAKKLCGQLFPTCSTSSLCGNGYWESPREQDQASATFGSTGTRNYWQQNSDDDSGDDAYVYNSTNYPTNIANLPMMRIKFSLNSVTAIRMWHGFFTADPADVISNDDPDGDYAGVRFTSGDGYFKFCTSNDDTGFSMSAAGGNPVVDAIYFVEIELEESVVRFRIEDANGGLLSEEFISFQRPRDDQSYTMVHGIETTEAVAKSWRFYYQEVYAEF